MLMGPPPQAPASISTPFANRQANQLLAAQPGIGGMKAPGSIVSAAHSQGMMQPQMMAMLHALQGGGSRLGI